MNLLCLEKLNDVHGRVYVNPHAIAQFYADKVWYRNEEYRDATKIELVNGEWLGVSMDCETLALLIADDTKAIENAELRHALEEIANAKEEDCTFSTLKSIAEDALS